MTYYCAVMGWGEDSPLCCNVLGRILTVVLLLVGEDSLLCCNALGRKLTIVL